MYKEWGWYIIFKTMRHLFKTYYSYNYVLKQGKTIKWNSFRTWTMDSGCIKKGLSALKIAASLFQFSKQFHSNGN